MENKQPDFIPLTLAAIQFLRDLEMKRQAFLEGFIAASNGSGGRWEIATDGSGLTRTDK